MPRGWLPIEHILPQQWAENWPVHDEEAEEVRAEHVHRLGNLTLLTSSLNSKVSNGPWASKRKALQAHDTLLLNSRLLSTVDDIWDEAAIDSRTDAMIDVLLTTWSVPEGHKGIVVDPHEKSSGWIQIKHLVDAGLLTPGTRLTSRQGTWGTRTAIVRQDGLLEVDGKTFDTPSGAGRYVKGSVTNGWWFWSLPDGRRLLDVRAAYTGQPPEKTKRALTGQRSTPSSKRCRWVTGRPTAAWQMPSGRRLNPSAPTSRPANSARTPTGSSRAMARLRRTSDGATPTTTVTPWRCCEPRGRSSTASLTQLAN